MKAHQISVRLLADNESDVDLEAFIAIFHAWIREDRLADQQRPVDVQDYRHVANGPGVMLMAQEGIYGVDRSDGRLGFSFSRKRDLGGAVGARLDEALLRVIDASRLLEEDEALKGRLRFSRSELRLTFMNRLRAPQSPDTFGQLEPDVQTALDAALGTSSLTMSHRDDPRGPMSIDVVSDTPFDPEAVRTRLRPQ